MELSDIKEQAKVVKETVVEQAKNVGGQVAEQAGKVKEHIPEIPNPLQYLPDFSFNNSDELRDLPMLKGPLASQGYDWWWHSFTGKNKETGETKTFFIEFFTINPALGGKEPVFGQLPQNKKEGNKPSYLMVKAGAWGEDAAQIHRFFGWEDVKLKQEAPFLVSAGDCFLSENRSLGRVRVTEEEKEAHPEYMTDAGEMMWDLIIDKKVAFNVGYGAGRPLRDAEAFEMFWHAEGMKTFYSGKVVWNGQEYEVVPEESFGYADKNWGRDFTSPWVWLSSNCLTSRRTGKKLENSVFDIGGGRPKVGTVPLEKKLLSAVWYEGAPYEFNFSKFWTLTKTKFKCRENASKVVWRIAQETPVTKLLVNISCEKKDMLKIRYESPDGEMRHQNLWNGGTGTGEVRLYKKKISLKDKWEWELIDDMKAENVGCEYGEYEKN